MCSLARSLRASLGGLTSLVLFATLLPLSAIAQVPPPAPAAAPPAGGGGGASLAMESIVLEYQTLAESASRMDTAIKTAINLQNNPHASIVIATNADIGALVQLQATLGQEQTIAARLVQLKAAIKSPKGRDQSFKCNPAGKAPAPAPRPSSTQSVSALAFGLDGVPAFLTTNAAAIQTLIQTIASVGAVTETVAPAPGALSDTSLINLVAHGLENGVVNVYVPSVYPPGLVNHSFTGWSLIGFAIQRLEKSRAKLYAAADAKILDPDCQANITDTNGALVTDKNGMPLKVNQATITQITTEVTAASSLVDSYETSLFGGQAPAPPAAATAPAASPAAPAGAPAAATPPSGTTLQQLLYADLLLRMLGATPENPVLDPKQPYYLISVHSLESGGNTLTKANLFAGSHVFFSGGAISTFGVFRGDGSYLCSGISYGYRGFVPEDRMTAAITDQRPDPTDTPPPADGQTPTNHFTSSCVLGSVVPPTPTPAPKKSAMAP